MKNWIVGLVLVSLMAGCATPKPKIEEPVAPPVAATPSAETSPAQPDTAQTLTIDEEEPVNPPGVGPSTDPGNILSKRSVYFETDSDAVDESNTAIVQAHAKYLGEHATLKVRVEGNADERGSIEYNLALGQRRADGVKKMLLLGGAKDGQVDASSFGEEKPKENGHDEASWAQNRRADLVY